MLNGHLGAGVDDDDIDDPSVHEPSDEDEAANESGFEDALDIFSRARRIIERDEGRRWILVVYL